MGYQEPERTSVIEFDEGPYKGAEVTVRQNVGVGVYRALEECMTGPEDATTAEKVAAYDRLCHVFGNEVLRGWNVTGPNGEPRPPTPDGCALIAPEFLAVVVSYFLLGIRKPSPPLPSGSLAGAPAPVAKTRKRAKRRP